MTPISYAPVKCWVIASAAVASVPVTVCIVVDGITVTFPRYIVFARARVIYLRGLRRLPFWLIIKGGFGILAFANFAEQLARFFKAAVTPIPVASRVIVAIVTVSIMLVFLISTAFF